MYSIKNNIIFESNNIYFVKVNLDLIDDYLKMVNNQEFQNLYL